MNEPDEEKVTRIFEVRGRPVGFQAGRWGGALVAVERGEFPISQTGFRSLGGKSEGAVTPGFLEELARNHDREKAHLLERLREARKPTAQPIMNYIHASGAYEEAIQYGFFASDRDRDAFWSGAHQLLCQVASDVRFQPAPEPSYCSWKAEHCEAAIARARDYKALLGRLATGDFPSEMPMRLLGANAYLALPAKPSGEPKTDLGGYTSEMALELAYVNVTQRQTERAVPAGKPEATATRPTQLGLFEAPSPAPTVQTTLSASRGVGPSV